jgi:hypothetical protein
MEAPISSNKPDYEIKTSFFKASLIKGEWKYDYNISKAFKPSLLLRPEVKDLPRFQLNNEIENRMMKTYKNILDLSVKEINFFLKSKR